MLYNNSVYKERRRELRRNQTGPEKLLWSHIRNNKLGNRFWRQYSVGPYIIDFYSPKLRLAIELDGGQHSKEDAVLYDKERDEYLRSLNIKTLRFWNPEVASDIDRVLASITSELVPPLEHKKICYERN